MFELEKFKKNRVANALFSFQKQVGIRCKRAPGGAKDPNLRNYLLVLLFFQLLDK